MATEPTPRDPAEAPAHEGILVTGLTVRYRGTAEAAISDVSCDVPPGAGLCITGGESAGKSTLIRALVGLVPPGRGFVSVLGGSPQVPAIRHKVGYGPERMPFPRGMRVSDAVRLVGAIRGTDAGVDSALERVGLPPGDRRLISSLDLGEVRRVSLACAITGAPRVLVLDDPWEFPETVEVIRSARADGVAVVVGTPDPGGFPALLGATLALVDGAAV